MRYILAHLLLTTGTVTAHGLLDQPDLSMQETPGSSIVALAADRQVDIGQKSALCSTSGSRMVCDLLSAEMLQLLAGQPDRHYAQLLITYACS